METTTEALSKIPPGIYTLGSRAKKGFVSWWKSKNRRAKFGWISFAILIALVAGPPLIPMIWSWDFHYLGMFDNSWSMASPNKDGIMPLSYFYTEKTDEYEVGDVISFYHDDEVDEEDGGAVKQICKDLGDSFLVHGLNKLNSDAPFEVPKDAVNGEVVWRGSLLPTRFWRWLSMDWTLTDNKIKVRAKSIFSLTTTINALSEGGRFRNGILLKYAAEDVVVIGERREFFAIDNGNDVNIFRYGGNHIKIFKNHELFWGNFGFVVHDRNIDYDHGFSLFYPDSEITLTPVDKDGKLVDGTEVHIRARS